MARILNPHWVDDGEHRWLVFNWRADHNSEFLCTLHQLKVAVPVDCRQWEEERKQWLVREDYVDLLIPLFSNLRGSLEAMASQGSLAF